MSGARLTRLIFFILEISHVVVLPRIIIFEEFLVFDDEGTTIYTIVVPVMHENGDVEDVNVFTFFLQRTRVNESKSVVVLVIGIDDGTDVLLVVTFVAGSFMDGNEFHGARIVNSLVFKNSDYFIYGLVVIIWYSIFERFVLFPSFNNFRTRTFFFVFF